MIDYELLDRIVHAIHLVEETEEFISEDVFDFAEKPAPASLHNAFREVVEELRLLQDEMEEYDGGEE